MVKIALSRLEKLDPRDCWENEAADFTPWLAEEENLALLGDAIGLELELEAVEKDVGPFRADILCKNTADQTWVLVENQLAPTDHSHLGQLLTYAAGLHAVTIVWIARRFREEHRAALDWLNDATDKQINLFGLEIELWRIGDSAVAPKFNIVSEPNDWSVAPGGLSDTQRLQQDYWAAFREHVAEKGSKFKPTKALPQHWMNIAIGRTNFQLSAVASAWNSETGTYETGELRAEFVVSHPNAKEYFEIFESKSAQYSEAIGDELSWHNPAKTKSWKTYVRKTVDLADRTDWPNQHEWLRDKLDRMYEVFKPEVKQL